MNESQSRSTRVVGCQAGVFTAPGHPLELQTFPLPTPEAGEALVRVECCTICGSDLHTVSGARKEPTPSILGHEILGVVDSVGAPPPLDLAGVPLRPGDRITWSTSVSCGTCDRCLVGLVQKCRTLAKYGHERAVGRQALCGGLAEYLLLRRGSAAIRVSPDMPAEIICPVNCATATIAAAFRTSGPIANRRVLILGAGMLGVTATAFAKAHGAEAVVVCDVDARRLGHAIRFGADAFAEWHAEPAEFRRRTLPNGAEGFDVILELSGSPDAVESAFHVANMAAHIVLVGSVKKTRPVAIDPENVIRRWLTIHGVHNYIPADLQAAVTFLEDFGTAYPFAELVEYSFPLADVNAAFETALKSRPFRVAVRPWEENHA